MEKIVGIKFKGNNKVYYFAPNGEQDKYEKGMPVIVETARGVEYAQIVFPLKEVEEKDIIQPLKPIIRIATEKDKEQYKKNQDKVPNALKIAAEKIEKHKLKMKLIDCEYTFDGGKVIFYFTSEGRVDFRELVKDLASVFHIRIELRQIGIRDETRMLGGIAPCGRPCCCGSCMADFKKVSIKMAKTQGLSLNPTKISGLCGRLMCCLSYENEYYAEAYKKAPKVGGEVSTPDGKGIVVGVNMLKMEAKVKIEKDGALTFKDYPIKKLRFKANTKAEIDEELSDEIKEILD